MIQMNNFSNSGTVILGNKPKKALAISNDGIEIKKTMGIIIIKRTLIISTGHRKKKYNRNTKGWSSCASNHVLNV